MINLSPRLKLTGVLALSLFLVAGLTFTVFTLQNRTTLEQHASEHDDDDRAVDQVASTEEPHRINLKKLFERYRVCRRNNRPKKCWKNIEEILPPGLKEKLKRTVTPVPTTVLPNDPSGPTDNPPEPTSPTTEPEISSGNSQGKNVTLTINVCPHAIGNCGDNVAQGEGTLNPLNPTRNVKVVVKNENNQQVATFNGNVTYDSSLKYFKGDVLANLAAGSYLITVTVPGYLSAQVPGIQQIKNGTMQYSLPLTYLITGDVNKDNAINIQDYQIFISCYSDLEQSTTDCNTTDKEASDLNDDGEVNFIDYNVFLRELSAQRGI